MTKEQMAIKMRKMGIESTMMKHRLALPGLGKQDILFSKIAKIFCLSTSKIIQPRFLLQCMLNLMILPGLAIEAVS